MAAESAEKTPAEKRAAARAARDQQRAAEDQRLKALEGLAAPPRLGLPGARPGLPPAVTRPAAPSPVALVPQRPAGPPAPASPALPAQPSHETAASPGTAPAPEAEARPAAAARPARARKPRRAGGTRGGSPQVTFYLPPHLLEIYKTVARDTGRSQVVVLFDALTDPEVKARLPEALRARYDSLQPPKTGPFTYPQARTPAPEGRANVNLRITQGNKDAIDELWEAAGASNRTDYLRCALELYLPRFRPGWTVPSPHQAPASAFPAG